jgi:hypothetical protein
VGARHDEPAERSPDILEGYLQLSGRRLPDGTQEIHVQSRLARIVHQAGDEEDIAVPEGHAKGPAVRSDLDVVNLLTM